MVLEDGHRVPNAPDTSIVLDGLDTRFGNQSEERQRRRRSIEGLFSAWMDTATSLTSIKFKILLREDIWRQLTFENKSHLFGQTKKLEWRDQAEYIKVAVKQAVSSSETFRRLLEHQGILAIDRIDDWPEGETYRAWQVLVGERMRGGRTAFTRNWIWSRLADGNWDHSPRFLLQLLHEAVPWEQREQQRSPYGASLIRSRALIDCLHAVSDEAKNALVEEFPELNELLARLAILGRTPVLAEDLEESGSGESIDLAREIWLLAVYEERDGEIRRYKVPEIYRLALGMTRSGPA